MSGLNPSEISSVLKDKISGLDLKAETKNEGTIYTEWAMLCMVSS